MTIEQYLILPRWHRNRIKQNFIEKYGFYAYDECDEIKWNALLKYLKSIYYK